MTNFSINIWYWSTRNNCEMMEVYVKPATSSFVLSTERMINELEF